MTRWDWAKHSTPLISARLQGPIPLRHLSPGEGQVWRLSEHVGGNGPTVGLSAHSMSRPCLSRKVPEGKKPLHLAFRALSSPAPEAERGRNSHVFVYNSVINSLTPDSGNPRTHQEPKSPRKRDRDAKGAATWSPHSMDEVTIMSSTEPTEQTDIP